jgi:hypothetical protein
MRASFGGIYQRRENCKSSVTRIAVDPLTRDVVDGSVIGDGHDEASLLVAGGGLNWRFGGSRFRLHPIPDESRYRSDNHSVSAILGVKDAGGVPRWIDGNEQISNHPADPRSPSERGRSGQVCCSLGRNARAERVTVGTPPTSTTSLTRSEKCLLYNR